MLVLKGGLTQVEAHQELKGTLSKDKNEILFSRFQLNYNDVEEVFKKGTILLRKPQEQIVDETVAEDEQVKEDIKKLHAKPTYEIIQVHENLIDCEAFYVKYALID